MSLHLLILHRRELTFSYEICLPASGNDQNRVLMMIPFEESTLVRCLGGCVLKSVVLQSDLKSLWLIYLASCKILDKSSRADCPAAREGLSENLPLRQNMTHILHALHWRRAPLDGLPVLNGRLNGQLSFLTFLSLYP